MIRYRMLFLSPKTFFSAAVGALFLASVGAVLSALAGELTIFTAACLFLIFFLCAGLVIARKKEDVLRISGLVGAILPIELCRYLYLTEQYLGLKTGGITSLGLVACIMFSLHIMICFIILLTLYDHFTIFLGKNSGRTKLIVNQFLICVLLLCFLLLAMANWSLGGGLLRQFCGAAIFLSELCLFVTVACCELYLTVDGKALQADRRKEARQ